ncbi:MAG: hypothetical protein ACXWP6_01620 [Ktedonobacterales bacterium]
MWVHSAISRLLHVRGIIVAVLSLSLAIVLTACGTKGYAPPLGPTTRAALADTQTQQAIGTATFTPVYAMHATVYYKGHVIPTTGAQTPAQLRKGSCFGPVAASLTDGAPKADTATATTQLAPSGGMYVAIPTSADWYITVLARPNDATAPVVACGNPLSERRQFFDLYPPAVGNGGTALGTALVEPIVATQLQITFQSGASPVTQWALHSGSCSGPLVGSNTTGAGGIVFSTAVTGDWVTAQLANGTAVCGPVKS